MAIKACHKRADRIQMQMNTWIPNSQQEVFIFMSSTPSKGITPCELYKNSSNCYLIEVDDISDEYDALPYKTHAICRWALQEKYDNIILCDDDCYLRPQYAKELFGIDYWGMKSPHAEYCWGATYGLTAKSMEIIVANEPTLGSEDVMTGEMLLEAGILASYVDSVMLLPKVGGHNHINYCSISPEFVSVAELEPGIMSVFHEHVVNNKLTGKGPIMSANRLWGHNGRSDSLRT